MSLLRRRVSRDRPRVVHITTTDMSLDWLLGPQLVAFETAGYEVIGMSAAGPHVPHLAAMGIDHVDVASFTRSNNPLDDLRAFGQLVRLLRSLRPDIVHTHNPKPGILGRIAARLTRTPLVVNTQHGLWAQPTDRWQRRLPVYAAERIAAAFGDVELVQNPEDVDTLVDTLRIPSRRVRLLGNGVDLARFDPDSRRLRRQDRGCGPSGASPTTRSCVPSSAGWCARRASSNSSRRRIRSRRQGSPARFVVIGPTDSDKSDAIGTEVFDRAEADGVVFTGSRDDMTDCYAAADLFVTASWREGFPRSAMEAAAMGLPTVATDIRGNRQVIDDGTTGLLVPVRDAAAIAAAVERLVGDPSLRASMGAAARRRAAAEFDQQRVIDRTIAAYETLRR